MKNKYTCNRFCQEVLLLKSLGTSSKWLAKGYIVLDADGFVDIDRTLAVLLSSDLNKAQKARDAIRYFENGNMHIKNDMPIDIVTQEEVYQAPVTHYNYNHNVENDITTSSDTQMTLVESMIDKNIIDTKLKKITLNEKIGKLIDRETVLRTYENILIGLKKDLLSIARSKIGLILREKDNPLIAEKILSDAIHQVLEKNCKHNETY